MAWKLVRDERVLRVQQVSESLQGDLMGITDNFHFRLNQKLPKKISIDFPSPKTFTLATHYRIRCYKDTEKYLLPTPCPSPSGYLHVSLVSAEVNPSHIPRFHFEEMFLFGKERLSLLESRENIGIGILMNILNGASPHYIRGYSTPKNAQERTDFNIKRSEINNEEVVKKLTSLSEIIPESDLYDVIRFLKLKSK